MGERREIAEVESRQPLVERLLLAQRLDTIRAPAGIELTLRHTIPRGEAHEGGTKQRADKSQKKKSQQAAKPETNHFREVLVSLILVHAEKRCQMRHPARRRSGASNNAFLCSRTCCGPLQKEGLPPKGRQWERK